MVIKDKLVRMEWEKPYKVALIDALRPFGDVLQVGFGLGLAASHIQTYRPKSQTIIESDPAVAEKARKFGTVIEDTWQNAMPHLGVFDAIFFNEFPLINAKEVVKNRESGSSIIREGKEVLAMVKRQIPQLTDMRYSDQDIDDFFEHHGGRSNLKEVPRFLAELKQNGQISEEQYERVVQKYQLERTMLTCVQSCVDPCFAVLEACLKKHMRKGSRFSCFCNNPSSKYEDAQFFEHIITNANVDYRENLISVEVPKECEYYPFNEALVMSVEKGVNEPIP